MGTFYKLTNYDYGPEKPIKLANILNKSNHPKLALLNTDN
jgi:hypothetical protein